MIPVFYSEKMVVNSESYSPSSAKPAQVVASWKKKFPIVIVEPTPVTVDELFRAHKRQHVLDILDGKADNGFGNKSAAISASLPYTSGAMLSAARHVLTTSTAAAAPCSGFHHAEFSKVEGFCTFNGLMVTAFALKDSGVGRVGILDLDMHYGNGTDNIIKMRDAQNWVRHFTGGLYYKYARQVPDFFAELPRIVKTMSDCDIVLYQAGADPHVNDPQGGWLTTRELQRRDAIVFETLAKNKIPVVWNLAGGYQIEEDGSIPKVLEIHDNTMQECVSVFGAKCGT